MPKFVEQSVFDIPLVYRSSFFQIYLLAHVNALRSVDMSVHDAIKDFQQAFGCEEIPVKVLYSTYNRKQKQWLKCKDTSLDVSLYDGLSDDTIKHIAFEIAKHIKHG